MQCHEYALSDLSYQITSFYFEENVDFGLNFLTVIAEYSYKFLFKCHLLRYNYNNVIFKELRIDLIALFLKQYQTPDNGLPRCGIMRTK